MIVGSKYFTLDDVVKNSKNSTMLRIFSDSLIPKFAECIPGIKDNQRYLVAVVLRCSKRIPFDIKTKLCEELLEDVKLSGVLNDIYDVFDLLLHVDNTRFEAELNERRTRNVARQDYE